MLNMGLFFVVMLFVALDVLASEGTESTNATEDRDAPAEYGSGMSINQEEQPLEEYESQKDPSSVTGTAQFLTAEGLLPQKLEDVLTNGCPQGYTDESFCKSYFSNYINNVKKWADDSNLVFDEHFWKACKMLSETEGLVDMCCNRFRSTCLSPLQENIHKTGWIVSLNSSISKATTAPSEQKHDSKDEEKRLKDHPLEFKFLLPPEAANVLTNGCPESHTDQPDCESYFSNYFNKVKEWADKSGHDFYEHLWEACKYLSEVKYLAEDCCSSFRSTCLSHLQENIHKLV